jgi:hypothetical protein
MFVQKTLVIGWGYCRKVKQLSGKKEPTELDEAAIALLKINKAVNRGFTWSSLGVKHCSSKSSSPKWEVSYRRFVACHLKHYSSKSPP